MLCLWGRGSGQTLPSSPGAVLPHALMVNALTFHFNLGRKYWKAACETPAELLTSSLQTTRAKQWKASKCSLLLQMPYPQLKCRESNSRTLAGFCCLFCYSLPSFSRAVLPVSIPAICISITDLVQAVSFVLCIQYPSDTLGPHNMYTCALKGDIDST